MLCLVFSHGLGTTQTSPLPVLFNTTSRLFPRKTLTPSGLVLCIVLFSLGLTCAAEVKVISHATRESCIEQRLASAAETAQGSRCCVCCITGSNKTCYVTENQLFLKKRSIKIKTEHKWYILSSLCSRWLWQCRRTSCRPEIKSWMEGEIVTSASKAIAAMESGKWDNDPIQNATPNSTCKCLKGVVSRSTQRS